MQADVFSALTQGINFDSKRFEKVAKLFKVGERDAAAAEGGRQWRPETKPASVTPGAVPGVA